MNISHPFEPIYNKDSRILILGTMPSPKSRENQFYYGHPQNRFWKVIADVLNQQVPETNQEKTVFLHQNKIALWDVLQSCDIKGASDSSIKNMQPNNFTQILNESNIKTIFTTGKKSYDIYQKLIYPKTKLEAIYLPSTSPANQARFPYPILKEHWQIILKYL